jgi:dienelactone hydrolase
MRSAFLLVLLMSAPSLAKPVQKRVMYQVAGKPFEGALVYDDASTALRPGLVMVPNYMGVTEANLKQATEVAGQDYVLFVADMYGKGAQPKSQDDASKAAGAVKGDRKLMRARVNQALSAFLNNAKEAPVDPKRIGAIGFCFGGTAAMELAKSNADIKGAVSFHGGLDAVVPTLSKPRAKILALHGADDPFVPEADIKAFAEDLRKIGADWTLVQFGGAVHSFTDPGASNPGKSMYDEKTAKRAYLMMRNFFAEAFAG